MMMELGLSLGASSKALTLMEKKPSPSSELQANNDLNTTLSIGPIFSTSNNKTSEEEEGDQDQDQEDEDEESKRQKHNKLSCVNSLSSSSSHLHDLLPHHSSKPLPLSSFSWHPPSDHNCDEARGSNLVRGLKVKTMPADEEEYSEERTVLSSSPMSGASSFRQVDLSIYSNNNNYGSSNNRKRKVTMMMNESQGDEGNYNYYDHHQRGGCSSRASDEDDNMDVHGGGTRKKLRLSKEQSAFLEESFKEHTTLNPKQKLALSKQLNLRPRQVEVWFQNRRARTKLKQTEVDCEYLKRCCETLSEENRRLQKELQELRALKASNSNPFFMQLPATTLTMCPSCERVAPNNSSSNNNNNNNNNNSASASNSPKPIATFPFSRPKFYPFPHSKPHQS